MNRLSSEKILLEKKTDEPDTITNLALNHKALSDVSCLVDFKNLEKLDLGFNNLSSLQGLKSCISLKWLSVIENKLQSLKGIEGLTKLTVLNAGKNKLTSMDEVQSLVNLGALILNDNEIDSICKLDRLQKLNTLVLSRNPISNIGKSLQKVKSITKLSLSNCQLETVDSSIMFCTELKELRLSHNKIKTIPTELGHNLKLQNLDLGNNMIISWSVLKVLGSLTNLRSLNLQGNPIAEKDKTIKKIKKLLPNLQIYNSKPTDQNIKKEKKRNRILEADDSLLTTDTIEAKVNEDKSKPKIKEVDTKENDLAKKDSKRKSKKTKGDELNMIDDGETPFMEIIDFDNEKNPPKFIEEIKVDKKGFKDNTIVKKVKNKRKDGAGPAAFQLISSATEVGMGGASTWDN